MSRRHVVAVGVALVSFAVVLAQPLWIRTTGQEVTVAVRPVDPLSFFRGNYMDVRYGVDFEDGFNRATLEAPDWLEDDSWKRVFVRFAEGRPATPLGVTAERPDLGPGEFCVRARANRWQLDFPEIEQLFVTPERARIIESGMDDSVAVLRVTSSCRAQIIDIERR